MTVHPLRDRPPPALARALEEFEAEFTYPLGPGRWFRISHGEDYPRFFRAMGEAVCLVAEQQGRVVGTLGLAVRRLLFPDGSERAVAYAGDLKVAGPARRSLAYLHLVLAAEAWLRTRAEIGFCVVMDGTSASPLAYMGRLGIPSAAELAKIVVLRIPCRPELAEADGERYRAGESAALACYRDLSRGRYACLGGQPEERSALKPAWLLHPDGSACGRLEDTRRAKRLLADGQGELISAHLACFACRTPDAGAELIRAALARCGRLGLPALFVAVPADEASALGRALDLPGVVEAPATVYGVGLPRGPAWHVSTSEI